MINTVERTKKQKLKKSFNQIMLKVLFMIIFTHKRISNYLGILE